MVQNRTPRRGRGRRRPERIAALIALLGVVTLVGTGATLSGALGPGLALPRLPWQTTTHLSTPISTPTPPQPGAAVPAKAFETRHSMDRRGRDMLYYLYGPDGFVLDGKYPLVLLLHGGGERYDPALTPAQNRDVLLRQTYVQAFTSPEAQARWPSFVVAPQAPLTQRWVGTPAVGVSSYTLPDQPTGALAEAMEIVRALRRTYPQIDGNRIYVGGISMGGFGAWEAAERWPDVFAAAFPIAGAGDPHAAAALTHVPIWAFHGSADTLVPVQGSRLMVQAARAAGGTVCYTEYPGAWHDVWFTMRPLNDPRVLSWIFVHSKALPAVVALPACPVLV